MLSLALVALLGALPDDDNLSHRKRKGPPPIVVPDRSEATWHGSPDEFVNARTGDRYATSGMKPPALSTWYGADHWSSSGKNRHSVPGRVPGDVLYLAAGEYENFRVTRSWDLHLAVIEQNPTRWVSDTRTYTYLWEDGTLRLGQNNRDRAKGTYVLDDWFQWGHDPQTWIVGKRGQTVIKGGRTYLEWAGALSFVRVIFRGPTSTGGSEAIVQTENHYVHDSHGNKMRQQPNWPEPGSVYGEWAGLRDIEFKDCHIDGEWDFVSGQGQPNKWGFLTYRVGRSSRGPDIAGWRWHGGSIGGIKGEHCTYHHNVQAMSPKHMAIHYRDVDFGPAARTAIQITARTTEGPDGLGRILIERCRIRNVCLEQGGGGSAITLAGNHDGRIIIRRVDCWLGDGSVQTDNVTGGFVSYQGKDSGGRPTRSIVIEDSTFKVGPLTGRHAARRPNLQIGNATNFTLRDTAVHQAVGAREAIAVQSGIGTLTLGDNDVRGDILYGSQIWRDADQDGDGWDDGLAWALFMEEVRTGRDTNGDGILAAESGVVGRLVLE